VRHLFLENVDILAIFNLVCGLLDFSYVCFCTK
jgi:hypothetical protein